MPQAALVAGTAVYGAYAQNKAAKEQQKLSNRNASMLDDQADDALRRGELDVQAVRRRSRALIGRQRAAAASQGIDVDTGSPAALQAEAYATSAVDEAQARDNAFDEAWGIKGQASNQRLSGTYARRAGRNQALGQVLGGIGDTARTYQRYDRPQIVGTELED